MSDPPYPVSVSVDSFVLGDTTPTHKLIPIGLWRAEQDVILAAIAVVANGNPEPLERAVGKLRKIWRS